ncbi:MAG: type II toxin-antitoxin system VapC family toxin [Micrococcales bacterium]|nr:type II toxin-antitoxin system VapC family toxin [Micrococcales bacterium]
MIGIDTNVLVRKIIRDDEEQAARADAFLASLTTVNPGYVTHIVLVETWWVLTRVYGKSIHDAAALIDTILDIATITTQDYDLVTEALDAVTTAGADFADAMIVAVARRNACQQIRTFEKGAVRHANMTEVD